ncbi:MAG: hypothetical protein WCT77_12105 [Bacteroidota bacterium]
MQKNKMKISRNKFLLCSAVVIILLSLSVLIYSKSGTVAKAAPAPLATASFRYVKNEAYGLGENWNTKSDINLLRREQDIFRFCPKPLHAETVENASI